MSKADFDRGRIDRAKEIAHERSGQHSGLLPCHHNQPKDSQGRRDYNEGWRREGDWNKKNR